MWDWELGRTVEVGVVGECWVEWVWGEGDKDCLRAVLRIAWGVAAVR